MSYPSRAIMCVKSSKGAEELLHHLEEKMGGARVQLAVLEVVQARPTSPAGSRSVGHFSSSYKMLPL